MGQEIPPIRRVHENETDEEYLQRLIDMGRPREILFLVVIAAFPLGVLVLAVVAIARWIL